MALPKSDYPRLIKDLIAGATAGAVCGTIFQPLDVIKVNLIVLPNSYNLTNRNSVQHLTDITKMIYAQEGWKGFWLGITPSVIRTSASCAIYFSLLRSFNNYWIKGFAVDRKYISDFLDSGVARVLTSLATNPLNMIKTQWELLDYTNRDRRLFSSLVKLYKADRSKVFVIGTFPMICEEFLYGGIFNAIYEYLNRKEHVNKQVHKYIYVFANGIFAGAIGAILTQPFEIARTKIQSKTTHWHPPNGKNLMMAAFVYVYGKYGWKGFLKGFYPRFLKKTLMAAASFSLYELIRQRNLEK